MGEDIAPMQTCYPFRYFIFMAMAVTRLCVASMWLQSEAPSYEMWRAKFYNVFNLEFSLYRIKSLRKKQLGIKI